MGRAGLGESWVSLTGKGWSGTGATAKRVSAAPEGAGESGQLSFAVESHRRLPAIERRRHVNQHCKGCKTIPPGSLEGTSGATPSSVLCLSAFSGRYVICDRERSS
jgi:hypothetical protein